jgi:hypothetical protein
MIYNKTEKLWIGPDIDNLGIKLNIIQEIQKDKDVLRSEFKKN